MKISAPQTKGKRPSFGKNVGVLLSGTFGTQLLALIAAPFLTRVYSGSDFGALASFVAFVSLAGIIGTLRLELAIALPEEDKNALALIAVGLTNSVLMALSFFAAITYFEPWLSEHQNLFCSTTPFQLLPLGILGYATFELLRYWELRRSKYSSVSRALVLSNLVTVGCQVFANDLGELSLIHGFLAGKIAGVLVLFAGCLSSLSFRTLSIRQIVENIRRYNKFPRYTTFESLLNGIGAKLPPVILSAWLGQSSAGFFSIAHRYSATPIAVLTTTITQVFISDGAKAKREGTLQELSWKMFRNLSNLASGSALISVICAPEVFSVVLGDTWRPAGQIAQVMTPWVYCLVIAAPLSGLLTICEKQVVGLRFQSALSILRVAALIIGVNYGSVQYAIATYSLVSALCWSTLAIFLLKQVGISTRDVLRLQAKSLVRGLLFSVPVMLTKLLISPSDIGVTIVCVASLCSYFVFSYLKRNE